MLQQAHGVLMDFPNAELPSLKPLQHSFAFDTVENELKQLFIALFKEHLSTDVFDANVLGSAHLGSVELVSKSITYDGLALIKNNDDAVRYLYRAWKGRNANGRGLHFLRTYLQMLYPNQITVKQMVQTKTEDYPLDLFSSIDYLDDDSKFLTNRIEIDLSGIDDTHFEPYLKRVLGAIIPARFIPVFKIWRSFEIDARCKETLPPDVFNRLGLEAVRIGQFWVDGTVMAGVEDIQTIDDFYLDGVVMLSDLTIVPRKISDCNPFRLGLDGDPVLYEIIENVNETLKLNGEWVLSNLEPESLSLDGSGEKHNIVRTKTLLDVHDRTRLSLSGRWKLGGAKHPDVNLIAYEETSNA